MTSPADTVSAAYARGFSEGRREGYTPDTAYAPMNLRLVEIRDAIDSWTKAQDQHEHTSYYGAFHVRAMRAYWLGRMRATRA